MTALKTVDVPLELEEDCTACAERLEHELRRHRGVAAIEPDPSGSVLRVSYDPDLCALDCVSDAARELRLELAHQYEHRVLHVGGMDCYDCAQTIERSVCRVPGVSNASVNFPAARMRVEYETGAVGLDTIADRVRRLGYEVSEPGTDAAEAPPAPWWRGRDGLTAAALALLGLALVLDLLTGVAQGAAVAAYAAAIVVGGLPVARSGLAALRATLRPDINLLMTIAVIGATAIDAWLEAALVVVLFSIGEALEGRAVDRARRELAGLVSLAPDVARVRRAHAHDGGEQHVEEVEVPVSELQIGDLVVVRPGERIPADGTVAEGTSAVDQAPITGESTPVDKEPGDAVFAGSLNSQGALVVRADRAPGDTTLDKIGRLVAEAQARKSPSERWVSAFARVYTPAVIVVAVLVATVPLGFGVDFSDAFYSALALLILACPCALVISTPVSIVSALGRASATGVLVKGGAHLEAAATIRTVAFDKTGTLTQGRPRLVAVEPLAGGGDGELLRVAASLEQGSEHPLARAIVTAASERGLRPEPVEGFRALTGLGASARLDGTEVTVGNPRLFGEGGLPPEAAAAVERLRAQGQTAVLVARDGSFLGVLGLADQPRPEAAEAVAALARLGIRRTVLLTGDSRPVAEAIARDLGIAETRAELLPEDKAAALAELGSGTAMVGDGVNDAPALAAADLGIAMGSAGSDTAIEVADIALMGDEPGKVAGLIGLARWTRAVVRQNIAFSLATKAAAVIVLAAGALPLWGAVATDVGASLIVVANGLRLLRQAPGGPLRGAPLLDPAGRAAPAALQPSPSEGGPACDCCHDE